MSMTAGAKLIVKVGDRHEETVSLEGRPINIGRQPDNDVVIAEPGVSRHHAEILKTPAGYSLKDLRSTNGTFVNSVKLADGEHLLHDGDRIQIGASKTTLVFLREATQTLRLTLVEPPMDTLAVDVLWPGEEEPETPVGTRSVASRSREAAQAREGAPTKPEKEALHEGTVRLNVRVEGGMGLVVTFTQQLRDRPEFRLLRLSNNPAGGVDIWLGLRQPIPLRKMLAEMDGVAEVSPTAGRDLSPGSDDPPLTVTLRPHRPPQPPSNP